jgi:hypothetical protein
MIPGSVSKVVEGAPVASADKILPRSGEVIRVTGATTINTISPPLGIAQNQVIYLIPTDGAVILGTAGNILAGVTMAQNRVAILVWLKSAQKWYIGA